MKKIVFVTGTRADFGKMRPMIERVSKDTKNFEYWVFVTGMHTLNKYGLTWIEVRKCGYNYFTYINQVDGDRPSNILANTIEGFDKFIAEIEPDLIVVHGDRIEAWGAAQAGFLSNHLVAHIEGGECSGTRDEHIRHSISKIAHIHYVSNNEAKERLIRLGENPKNIFVVGSTLSDTIDDLPPIDYVKDHYEFPFDDYSIFVYHPVTTEMDKIGEDTENVMSALLKSDKKYIVIEPNNDDGNDIIRKSFQELPEDQFKIIPSMRFECYLSLLKNADFIIGNSSSGIHEAPFLGVPTINIGTRQFNRSSNEHIINVDPEEDQILDAITRVKPEVPKSIEFGKGDGSKVFYETLLDENTWKIPLQKYFFEDDK
jgi:UDP-N-acetylglucosamine 2-epimerase (hydrolysing)